MFFCDRSVVTEISSDAGIVRSSDEDKAASSTSSERGHDSPCGSSGCCPHSLLFAIHPCVCACPMLTCSFEPGNDIDSGNDIDNGAQHSSEAGTDDTLDGQQGASSDHGCCPLSVRFAIQACVYERPLVLQAHTQALMMHVMVGLTHLLPVNMTMVAARFLVVKTTYRLQHIPQCKTVFSIHPMHPR